jgi:uncharacterized protein (TIGR01777 family)
VLIGGGSGLIGSRLTEILLQKGYHVSHLGRKAKGPDVRGVKTFAWDIHKQAIDTNAFEGVTVVINLAGANVNGHRWTEAYKEEMRVSRTGSTKLIVDFLNNRPHQVKQFLSGSAVGYYGYGSDNHWFRETDPPGNDFMAQLAVEWEKVADQAKVNTAHLRTGIIISDHDGAIEEMAKPIKLYVGSPLGSGKQVVSWIHLDDHCGIIMHIIENNLAGTFNLTAPQPATNEEMTRVLAKKLRKPLWLPNVPGFVLRIVLGEMADAVLNGSKVSSEKIQSTGYKFKYPTLQEALDNIEH